MSPQQPRRRRIHSRWYLVGVLLLIIMAGHYPTEFVVEHYLEDAEIGFFLEFAIEAVVLAGISGALVWTIVVTPLWRNLTEERQERLDREAQLEAESRRQRFESTVGRAVDMATTEEQTLEVLQRALVRETPGIEASLLLADSSNSHLKTALNHSDTGSARSCSIAEPRQCPAIRTGSTLHFSDSGAVDACPHLAGGPERAATCVPVNATGRAVGVLHVPGPAGRTLNGLPVETLETAVTAVGRRLDLLRVMERTSLQAATDSLTGLINRRSVEHLAADLLRRQVLVAVVMADLDRFKRLNDTHGHEAGDRALRLYASTLRSAARTDDLVSRYGGEEFLLVMPGLDAAGAVQVLTRAQEALAEAVGKAHVPPFSASYGVTDSTCSDDLRELIAAADGALYQAKEQGRDRIVTATPARVPAASAGGIDPVAEVERVSRAVEASLLQP